MLSLISLYIAVRCSSFNGRIVRSLLLSFMFGFPFGLRLVCSALEPLFLG